MNVNQSTLEIALHESLEPNMERFAANPLLPYLFLFETDFYCSSLLLFFRHVLLLGIRVARSKTGKSMGNSNDWSSIAERRYQPNMQNAKVNAPDAYSSFPPTYVSPSASLQYAPTSSHKPVSKRRKIDTKITFVRNEQMRYMNVTTARKHR